MESHVSLAGCRWEHVFIFLFQQHCAALHHPFEIRLPFSHLLHLLPHGHVKHPNHSVHNAGTTIITKTNTISVQAASNSTVEAAGMHGRSFEAGSDSLRWCTVTTQTACVGWIENCQLVQGELAGNWLGVAIAESLPIYRRMFHE